MSPYDLTQIIKTFSEAPDSQIDKHSTDRLKSYLEKGEITPEGNLRVLRNCLDACVVFAHGNAFSIIALRIFLDQFPKEPENIRKEREIAEYPDYYGPLYEEKPIFQ